jgi:hypothetical protein
VIFKVPTNPERPKAVHSPGRRLVRGRELDGRGAAVDGDFLAVVQSVGGVGTQITAGIRYSRATVGPCGIGEPVSVTSPPALRNSRVHPGSVVAATRMSPSSMRAVAGSWTIRALPVATPAAAGMPTRVFSSGRGVVWKVFRHGSVGEQQAGDPGPFRLPFVLGSTAGRQLALVRSFDGGLGFVQGQEHDVVRQPRCSPSGGARPEHFAVMAWIWMR